MYTDKSQLKKIFWTEAATGGLILGLAMFLLSLTSYYFELALNYSTLLSVIQVLLIAGVMYAMGRKMARIRGEELGFSYGQSMNFILATMIFTGVIYGLGEYVMQVWVDPQYFKDLYEAALYKSTQDEALIEQALKAREQIDNVIKNPGIMVLSGIFSMIIYGGIVGLIVSAFLKRPANPFVEPTSEDKDE